MLLRSIAGKGLSGQSGATLQDIAHSESSNSVHNAVSGLTQAAESDQWLVAAASVLHGDLQVSPAL